RPRPRDGYAVGDQQLAIGQDDGAGDAGGVNGVAVVGGRERRTQGTRAAVLSVGHGALGRGTVFPLYVLSWFLMFYILRVDLLRMTFSPKLRGENPNSFRGILARFFRPGARQRTILFETVARVLSEIEQKPLY